MPAIDLSNPALGVVDDSVAIGSANVAQQFTFANSRPDYVLTLQFVGAAGRVTFAAAMDDGEAMTGGFPIPADTAVSIGIPGGSGNAITKACVAMAGAGTCHYLYRRAVPGES